MKIEKHYIPQPPPQKEYVVRMTEAEFKTFQFLMKRNIVIPEALLAARFKENVEDVKAFMRAFDAAGGE